jgi:hypothetical protein
MKKRVNFILLVCCLVFVGCNTTKINPSSSSALAVSIPFDSYDSHPFRGYRHYNKFHVLLTNVSNEPVRVWQEYVSWGYYCLQLEIIDQDGIKHLLKKKPITFYSNAPDYVILQPGGSVVWNVNLDSKVWEDLAWLPNDKMWNVKVKAIYTVKNEEDPKKFDYNDAKTHGVWTGQAISEMYDFTLYGPQSIPAK